MNFGFLKAFNFFKFSAYQLQAFKTLTYNSLALLFSVNFLEDVNTFLQTLLITLQLIIAQISLIVLLGKKTPDSWKSTIKIVFKKTIYFLTNPLTSIKSLFNKLKK